MNVRWRGPHVSLMKSAVASVVGGMLILSGCGKTSESPVPSARPHASVQGVSAADAAVGADGAALVEAGFSDPEYDELLRQKAELGMVDLGGPFRCRNCPDDRLHLSEELRCQNVLDLKDWGLSTSSARSLGLTSAPCRAMPGADAIGCLSEERRGLPDGLVVLNLRVYRRTSGNVRRVLEIPISMDRVIVHGTADLREFIHEERLKSHVRLRSDGFDVERCTAVNATIMTDVAAPTASACVGASPGSWPAKICAARGSFRWDQDGITRTSTR